MDFYSFLYWLEGTGIAYWMTTSWFAFPFIEAFHVIGLALVFGTVAIVDLRLLGVPSTKRPFTEIAAEALRWTWLGFAISVITGLMMFVEKASTYFDNNAFRIKMILLLLAGINMIIFELLIVKTVKNWDVNTRVPLAAKIAGSLSLLFWTGVIIFGRQIGFTIGVNDAVAALGGF